MRKHIDDIQILRAVAAMAVLFFHAERELSPLHAQEPLGSFSLISHGSDKWASTYFS